jgi:hypothetical protein
LNVLLNFSETSKAFGRNTVKFIKIFKKTKTQKLVTDYLIRREEEPAAGFESDDSSDFEPTKKKELVELEYSSEEVE